MEPYDNQLSNGSKLDKAAIDFWVQNPIVAKTIIENLADLLEQQN
jgi:hypothetical protein